MDLDHAPETPPDFEVGIKFCNDVQLTHQHDEEVYAIQEYLDQIELGLADQEPDSFRRTHPGTKHVRLVSLTRRRGEDRHVYWTISSGALDCEHRSPTGR